MKSMSTFKSFNSYIEKSITANWRFDALTDYKGATLQYHDVARKIEKLHILFENSGVKQGDRIAVCGRNSAHWAVAFLSIITYGAVAVPILHEFSGEQIHNIVNHSGAKLLFVGDIVVTNINPDEMLGLEGIINIPDYSLHTSRSDRLTYAREHLNELFGKKYPRAFRQEHVSYYKDSAEELAMINYTSGTTGFSKGVMLPYRAIWGNVDFLFDCVGPHLTANCNTLSTLPMAHMYGLACEFLFPICFGCHLYFLNRLPSPAVIMQALAVVRPAVIFAVPLVIEKIIRKEVFPKIQNNMVKLLMTMPVINKKVKQKIYDEVHETFGGNAYQVVVGGAPINKEVEKFLHSIDYPITVAYGATECAPLVTFTNYDEAAIGSCGKPVKHMEVRIASRDPENIAGEIITRGENVMTGYYRNAEATDEALDSNGWYHTGDLATMSPDGHVYIRGRMKNMLLGANGQNVYPEEIEDKLNSMMLVNESIIVQKGDHLVALVYPDFETAKGMGLDRDDIMQVMEQNRTEINATLPAYSRLHAIELRDHEFEKTAKKSIKRYLYK